MIHVKYYYTIHEECSGIRFETEQKTFSGMVISAYSLSSLTRNFIVFSFIVITYFQVMSHEFSQYPSIWT